MRLAGMLHFFLIGESIHNRTESVSKTDNLPADWAFTEDAIINILNG